MLEQVERRRFSSDHAVVEIDLFPTSMTLTAGAPSATVSAVARNRAGQIVPSVTIYFVSSNPAVATVNKTTGLVTRITSGSVTITGQLTDPG